MQIEADVACGDWIRPRLAQVGGSVGAVVPTGFEAYARVLHPVQLNQTHGALSWAEVARLTGRRLHARAQFWCIAGRAAPNPVDSDSGWHEGAPRAGELDRATQTELIATLAAHDMRGAARECVVAVWHGWGFMRHSSEIEHAPRMHLPHRDYVLFRGALAEVPALGLAEPSQFVHFTPALLWAADASWCVAPEIDFDSTLVGGPRLLVDAVLTNAQLEAFEVEPGDSLAWDGDRVNGPGSSR
jgi:hypothetical protein